MKSRQWIERLVSINTTSRNSNLALIGEVRDWLGNLGVVSHLSFSEDRRKANLFATLPDRDGSERGGIIFSGHTDVVPVDGQTWSSEPFSVMERDGLLFGRGTADMKGFIAASLAVVPDLLALARRKPIHLAFSYDEEIGCFGAPLMLEQLMQRGLRPDGCIVGEPTSMRPVVAHKGVHVFRCTVHGRAAHSSRVNDGCNAIEYAAQLISKIRSFSEGFKKDGPYDRQFDVPFSTMSTNMIQGGIAVNTVPERCEFRYEFRNLPGHAPEALQSRIAGYIEDELIPLMRTEVAGASVEIEQLASVPSLDAAETDAIAKLVRALSGDRQARKVAYGTEAGLFQAAGVPTVICGPGSIDVAHAADEFISIEQLDRCEDFLRRVGHSLVSEAEA